MPYIKAEERRKLSVVNLGYFIDLIDSPGEFNYMLTSLCKIYLEKYGESYKIHNEIIGILESVKQEWYRKKISKYEDKKEKENGTVW